MSRSGDFPSASTISVAERCDSGQLPQFSRAEGPAFAGREWQSGLRFRRDVAISAPRCSGALTDQTVGWPDATFRLLVRASGTTQSSFWIRRGTSPRGIPAERLKGYRADEIIGKHFSIFYPPAVVASGKCEFEMTSPPGRTLRRGGIRVRRDGTEFWANVTITSLPTLFRRGAHRFRESYS